MFDYKATKAYRIIVRRHIYIIYVVLENIIVFWGLQLTLIWSLFCR